MNFTHEDSFDQSAFRNERFFSKTLTQVCFGSRKTRLLSFNLVRRKTEPKSKCNETLKENLMAKFGLRLNILYDNLASSHSVRS